MTAPPGTSGVIQATWIRPRYYGELRTLTGYELRYGRTGEPEQRVDREQNRFINLLDPSTLSYTFNDLDPDTEYSVRVRAHYSNKGNSLSAWSGASGRTGGAPRNSRLRAEFQDVPPKHNSPFTVEVHFSEEVSLSYKTLRDHAFTVTNGEVTGARRLNPPSNIAWEIAVDSFSEEAVTVVLPETTDCAAPGAICTEDGRKLSAEISATVEGPAPPETRPDLTVRVESVPATHDGTSAFDVRLAFSEDLADDFSYTTLRDKAFTVTNGAVMGARRLTPPSNIAWGNYRRADGQRRCHPRAAGDDQLRGGGRDLHRGRAQARAPAPHGHPGPAGGGLGGRCAGGGRRRRGAGLRGDARARGERSGDGRLRHLGRQRAGGRGLHGGQRDADVCGGRVVEDHRGGGARRCARRG